MASLARSMSPQESRVVLALSERGLRAVSREEIIKLLGASPKAVLPEQGPLCIPSKV